MPDPAELTIDQVKAYNDSHRPERMLRVAGAAFHLFQAVLAKDNEIFHQSLEQMLETFGEVYGFSLDSIPYIKDDLLAFAADNHIKVEAHLIPVEPMKKANQA